MNQLFTLLLLVGAFAIAIAAPPAQLQYRLEWYPEEKEGLDSEVRAEMVRDGTVVSL